MIFLDDVSLPGTGDITGVFHNKSGDLVAVSSEFRRLTEPPARRANAGRKPARRLGLYRKGHRHPFAAFERHAFPVNDVAFHPDLPVLAIGAGSYDGGWSFDGELLLWNWKTNEIFHPMGQTPEISRVAFSEGGDTVLAYAGPWDEGLGEDDPSLGDIHDLYFLLSAPFTGDVPKDGDESSFAQLQIQHQNPVSGKTVEADMRFAPKEDDIPGALSKLCGSGTLKTRSPIWDVAWFPDREIGFVHDDCLLQTVRLDDERTNVLKGAGHGCEVFGGSDPIVHVTILIGEDAWPPAFHTKLYRYAKGGLAEMVERPGAHTFSRSAKGSMLGRRDRSVLRLMPLSVRDAIYSNGEWKDVDLGDYEAINHFLRIDDAPRLFFLKDYNLFWQPIDHWVPPRKRKWFCSLNDDLTIRRHWQIFEDDGSDASHAMECTFAFLQERSSQSIFVAGEHYRRFSGKKVFCFLYKRDLKSGMEEWRVTLDAAATTLKVIPEANVVIAFLLNGKCRVFNQETGARRKDMIFAPDGVSTAIVSCAVKGRDLLIGTIDGRVALARLEDFL
ncbi:MAG: WD40 repeat domain-containing protein [Pseudomonadota bacterium]